MNSGGDVLARGAYSAQFSAGNGDMTDFEHDLAVRPEVVGEKYGLSEAEITRYQERRDKGEKLPDVKAVDTDVDGTLTNGVTVIDRRSSFNNPQPIKEVEKKYGEKQYGEFSPILDRILVKRFPDDPNMEMLEDGSTRDKRTGFVIPAKYRQHSSTGIVLSTGKFLVIGGVRIPMEDVVKPGDWAMWGDYNSEVMHIQPTEEQRLCDAVGVNYIEDPDGLRVVRVQDVRGIKHPKESNGL